MSKHPKACKSLRPAETSLLNERIRLINNTINMLSLQKDTCIRKLKEKIGEDLMKECEIFIEKRRETRHYKTMSRQKMKLEALWQKSNSDRGGCSNNIHSGKSDWPYQNNQNQNNRQNRNKWVINISDKPLSTDEERLLAHGPNYAIVLKDPPIILYVAAIEHACTKLEEGKAEEFRVQIKAAIQKIQTPKPNITRAERIAIADLRKDPSRMFLTADKEVGLVVMNTEDYKKKAEELLNQNTYTAIPSDPTMRLKNKLISMLKSIKGKGGMKEELYRRLYPTGAGSPKFYGLPKIQKLGMPLRPIVSSIGTVTYQTSKEVARILKPLVGSSPHHVKNTQDFIDQIKGIHLGQDQCMMSYDVKALFTSVPTTKAITIIKQLLEQDQELQQRTSLSIENILSLLEFCINSTYFSFQGKFYEQLEGAAMGSPLSPIVANLYMESFEVETIRSAPHPPYLWKRFVDDTFTILQSSQKNGFLEHINSIDQYIQFTGEDQRSDGAMPFLDILITPGRDGSPSTFVYRKPTHTDLYLQWDSHHTLTSKYSVIGTLQHRAQTIYSNPQLLQKEEQHLKNALKDCKYPTWALNRIQMKTKKQDSKQVPTNRTNMNNQKKTDIGGAILQCT